MYKRQDRAPHELLEFTATEGTWISVDVSPDGERLAFDLLGHLYEMPLEGGPARALTEGRSWNMFPRYSPDGARIAFTSDRGGSNDLWVLERETGALENVSAMDLPVFQGSWSLDGRFLYGTALNMRVRFPCYQFNFHGTRVELLPAGERQSANHFTPHPDGERLLFEHQDERLPASGPRLKSYDLATGAVEVLIERPGGACNPALSPDGRQLAYVHRDDRDTVLVVRDLESRRERVLYRALDRGRIDGGLFYGAYPNMDWTPDGAEVVFTAGGVIRAVDAATGAVREIPFEAPVRRKIDRTHRVPLAVPEGTVRTRSHRWARRTPRGILYESLGALHLRAGEGFETLATAGGLPTSPVAQPDTGRIYYAAWNDRELGALYAEAEGDGPPEKLTDFPSQYGSLAFSSDGTRLAFLRGAGAILDGTRLERETEFELCVLEPGGETRVVTGVRWTGNRYGKRPPTVLFGPGDERLYFTEYEDDTLTLKRVRPDGLGEETLYRFPRATRAVPSPDLTWIFFREYHRTFVTPFEFAGQPLEASAADGLGFAQRVDPEDGDFTEWSADGRGLEWVRGRWFCQKSLAEILAGVDGARRTDLSLEYATEEPESSLAFRDVRVLTMNGELEVLEGATVLVEGNRIAAVGADVEVPDEALLFDGGGFTLMPGMFDAHGHYGSPISALNVIEERPYGLAANLAYGVTTMFDVYGTTQKDFWLSDRLQKGDVDGPRLFSVGDPIFVTKYRTKMHRPIHSLDDALEHAAFNRDHGALCLKDYSNHTRAARQQLVAACRELGLNVVSESFADFTMNFTQLVDGFTGLEHTPGVTPLYDDVLRLFTATELGMTPTLVVVYNGPAGDRYFHQTERLWEDEKLLNFFRRDELLRLRRPTHYWDDDWYHPEMAAELHRLHEAGVLLQMGAHGQMMGLGAHWEMELFVHGGFTPLEAIQIATINGFRHHGLEGELGSIEAGKLADFVVLGADPRGDVRNTRAIEYVVKNGVLYAGADGSRIHPDSRPAEPMYFQARGD